MSAFSSHETLVVLRVLRTEAEIVGLCGFSSHIVEFRLGVAGFRLMQLPGSHHSAPPWVALNDVQ